MVNTEDFSKRLHRILEFYELSAAGFADKIEVGRSSISHILSGRNKPSLDFVMKIVKSFPEVELYWLLNGKGSFPPSEKPTPPPVAKPEISTTQPPREQNIQEKSEMPFPFPQQGKSKPIRKIVIFYEDGTFEAFEN
ncbi:helix-turn-helix domain-containing protein [Salegentibacter mishustinae]|uniref:DNA-binding protein n=1 Tax=Salegentibacter mishustinae TaxID=270918 RepID=A0A0Q9Z2W8_9FLAO|nr:helix-turn-helix transcriptional regulator [Salegentibacter mishustinae]KRG27158.1 DNA-binding protein [Salegentibacter mishustinae]PNW21391.1 DNA-binding protein [Salegentibacter mishustinae]PZX62669.1 DNA-binding XRE family transcriptional regulator [Salegentibacter mishustinae]GGW97434.1 transcriptional regulator [Salegentibacter mishustinae]